MVSVIQDHGRMTKRPRTPRKRPERPNQPLYIGQWIAALGLRQTDVAKDAGINEGYLSQLISGERTNPSGGILWAISRAMGIEARKLNEPPPSREILEALRKLDRGLINRLAPPKID